MTLTLNPFPAADSFVSRLDPRWKLAAALPTLVVIAALRSLGPAMVGLLAAVFLAFLSRIPRRWYLARIGAASLFLVLFVAPLPFLLHGPGPVWHLGPVALSSDGLRMALLLTAKALTILTLVLVLLATAPLDAILKAAHALRAPGLFIQLVLMTYRYVFLLAHELARVRTALRVRGYRNRANRHSYQTIGLVTGALLVRTYEQAERVGQAMRCRGFSGTFRSLVTFHTTFADVIAFVLVLSGASALLLWDLF